MTVKFSKQAIKQYKKYRKIDRVFKSDLEEALSLYQFKPDHPILRVHALKEELSACYSLTLESDLLVIFKEIKDGILITNIGTHDEVY
jgi:mRNA-degrading endonuclease YafQ of YafQ-DinJ toxin-antitoxin module